jgi:hypothetical protein
VSDKEQGYILLIPGWVDRICTPTEARVYGLINAFSQINNNGYCWLSVSGIAERLETAERHVKAALSSLKARGMISREASDGGKFITTPIPRGVTKPVPPRVTDSGSEGDGFRPEGVTDSVPQYKDLDKEDIKNESESRPPPPSGSGPDPLEPFLKPALELLTEPTGSERWESNNQFVCAGRRPLKKYPEIFMTGGELAETFKQYSEAGIPESRWRNAFQMVSAKLKTPRLGGGPVSCFAWLTGWVKTDLMQQITNEARMQQQQARGAK